MEFRLGHPPYWGPSLPLLYSLVLFGCGLALFVTALWFVAFVLSFNMTFFMRSLQSPNSLYRAGYFFSSLFSLIKWRMAAEIFVTAAQGV